jgi:hypothetical protein
MFLGVIVHSDSSSAHVKVGEALVHSLPPPLKAWDGQRNPYIGKARKSLMGDVMTANDLVLSQIELAQNVRSVDDELKSAWSAVETNVKIARDVY